jgi:hypothetical protein
MLTLTIILSIANAALWVSIAILAATAPRMNDITDKNNF